MSVSVPSLRSIHDLLRILTPGYIGLLVVYDYLDDATLFVGLGLVYGITLFIFCQLMARSDPHGVHRILNVVTIGDDYLKHMKFVRDQLEGRLGLDLSKNSSFFVLEAYKSWEDEFAKDHEIAHVTTSMYWFLATSSLGVAIALILRSLIFISEILTLGLHTAFWHSIVLSVGLVLLCLFRLGCKSALNKTNEADRMIMNRYLKRKKQAKFFERIFSES